MSLIQSKRTLAMATAKTLVENLQRRYPGRFQDGQLRTLQRRVKIWRGLAGPAREIFFSQIHEPWESSARASRRASSSKGGREKAQMAHSC